ncbi:uncharacterized protein LOC144127717 [Amblyomma americanum]
MRTFKDYQNLAETTTEFLWNKRRQSLPKAPMKQTEYHTPLCKTFDSRVVAFDAFCHENTGQANVQAVHGKDFCVSTLAGTVGKGAEVDASSDGCVLSFFDGTDGSVLPATGQAAAACVAPALGAALSCRLRVPANSTAAELAGLHLAADLLLLLPGQQPAVILTDSRAALQLLRQHQPRQHTVANLTARLMAIQDAGRPVSLQWLPSHVGITGNEAADQLAGSAHTNGSPVSSKVTQLDFARPALRQAVRALHPDPRVASGVRFMRVPDCLPRRERTLLLRLRTGCSWTPARLHRHGRAPSPACSFCGADETLGHLLCACPNLEAARRDMTAGYRNLGLPSYSDQDLLHPERSQTEAFRLLLEFLQSTRLATRL